MVMVLQSQDIKAINASYFLSGLGKLAFLLLFIYFKKKSFFFPFCLNQIFLVFNFLYIYKVLQKGFYKIRGVLIKTNNIYYGNYRIAFQSK